MAVPIGRLAERLYIEEQKLRYQELQWKEQQYVQEILQTAPSLTDSTIEATGMSDEDRKETQKEESATDQQISVVQSYSTNSQSSATTSFREIAQVYFTCPC